MEQPYHFTNLTLVGEDDELRLCDLKQNGNLYPHAVSCMGLAAGSFGLVSLQPQVQFCRRVVCKTGHSTSTSPPPTQFSISEYHRLLNIKGFLFCLFFSSNRHVCSDSTQLPKNFHEKKGADFLKGCENRVSDKSQQHKEKFAKSRRTCGVPGRSKKCTQCQKTDSQKVSKLENLCLPAAAERRKAAKIKPHRLRLKKTTPHLPLPPLAYKKKEPSWGRRYFCRWLYLCYSVHFCLSGIKSLTSPSMPTLQGDGGGGCGSSRR